MSFLQSAVLATHTQQTAFLTSQRHSLIDKAARDLVASCGELIAASVLSAELTNLVLTNKILHGKQAGILTAGEFGDAAIDHIDTTTIHQYLNEMIVSLFQVFKEWTKKEM